MAQSQGVSKSTVNNIWRAHNLQPHRTETFKLSRDPKFLEKMTDVVGLYLNPPQQAIILCVDAAPYPTITNATAQPPCSPPWRLYRARSSANAMTDIAIRSF